MHTTTARITDGDGTRPDHVIPDPVESFPVVENLPPSLPIILAQKQIFPGTKNAVTR